MSINIYDVEPMSAANASYEARVEQFARWMETLPDEPGTMVLTYGLLDSMPHSYSWVSAPAGDMISLSVRITDFFRVNTIHEEDAMLDNPNTDLVNEPGYFRSGQIAALQVGALSTVPTIQTAMLDILFGLAGWDVENWLATNSKIVGMDAAAQYVNDRALTLLLCGPNGEEAIDVADSPLGTLVSNGVLSVDDVDWLQSIADSARHRMLAVEARI